MVGVVKVSCLASVSQKVSATDSRMDLPFGLSESDPPKDSNNWCEYCTLFNPGNKGCVCVCMCACVCASEGVEAAAAESQVLPRADVTCEERCARARVCVCVLCQDLDR